MRCGDLIETAKNGIDSIFNDHRIVYKQKGSRRRKQKMFILVLHQKITISKNHYQKHINKPP